MKRPSPRRSAVPLLLSALALTACGPRAAKTAGPSPAASPAPAASAPAAARTDTARRGYGEADVRFMQHMMAHHAQAVTMAALVPARAGREDLKRLAERIDVSQKDEMATMRRWLAARGEAVPAVEGPHAGHAMAEHASMPGMATAAELAELEAARGTAFDRLFLQLMIRHHEGALVMVRELFASPGAGQEPQLFGFASDVVADQEAEIRRMRAVLAALDAR